MAQGWSVEACEQEWQLNIFFVCQVTAQLSRPFLDSACMLQIELHEQCEAVPNLSYSLQKALHQQCLRPGCRKSTAFSSESAPTGQPTTSGTNGINSQVSKQNKPALSTFSGFMTTVAFTLGRRKHALNWVLCFRRRLHLQLLQTDLKQDSGSNICT